MHYAASAYSKVAQATQSPRELEALILMKAATRLQAIRDDWDSRSCELDDALTYNRKLWTVLVSSVTRPENPLPAADQAEHRQSRPVHLQPHALADERPEPGTPRDPRHHQPRDRRGAARHGRAGKRLQWRDGILHPKAWMPGLKPGMTA